MLCSFKNCYHCWTDSVPSLNILSNLGFPFIILLPLFSSPLMVLCKLRGTFNWLWAVLPPSSMVYAMPELTMTSVTSTRKPMSIEKNWGRTSSRCHPGLPGTCFPGDNFQHPPPNDKCLWKLRHTKFLRVRHAGTKKSACTKALQ